jgi:hypothetical protein
MMFRPIRSAILWAAIPSFCLGLACIRTAHAQTAVDGAIGGTVLDGGGSAVSNADVTVLNRATNAVQTTQTDASGYFRALHLQPGAYNVTIAASGFETYHSLDMTVQVGVLTDVQARLAVGTAAQTVEVSGEAPLVNTTGPDFAAVVDRSDRNGSGGQPDQPEYQPQHGLRADLPADRCGGKLRHLPWRIERQHHRVLPRPQLQAAADSPGRPHPRAAVRQKRRLQPVVARFIWPPLA